MKNLAILGSTGSIGVQTLDVVRNNPELFRVKGLTAHSNIDLLEKQVREFRPMLVATSQEENYKALSQRLSGLTEVMAGVEGLKAVAAMEGTDTVVTAIVGIAGLVPTYAAMAKGKNIALANKETLVTAGRIMMEFARTKGINVLPVDSEHSALFQSIGSNRHKDIKKLILTASGGPFRGKDLETLKRVTLADALNHPNWKMGKKITIDSATMMNKGLEVIEAKWLFDMDLERIEVCVHPQSIIHSMVEFVDGSVIGQLGVPDMRLPIQYALTWPDRVVMTGNTLNLFEVGTLTFEKPNLTNFPCLRLAYEAAEAGDSACVVLNGANEAAVGLFLEGKITFMEIPSLIEKTLERHGIISNITLDDILSLDLWARETVSDLFEKR